ncbi:P1 family peptidase [Acidiferrimicrobium sp. IK]|uniref:P1 family peptidase n=1 Tax=Acidiferrimicrobium sp. IK TaxID=2871700 RepID=UPI0021CB03A9|nr:P1 family peptidase [Acidiferrimicrobium sp. IK]MCU4184955.1 P1 family peptidase [Acidiferrimicrobium sp. IK]
MTGTWVAGPTNSIVDVDGLRVGHHTRTGNGWLTGTTVVVGPPEGMVGGVDVRGGGPGTRETDVLGLTTAQTPVHAVVLGGGSAFGLAAASGVADSLEEDGVGVEVTTPYGTMTVPIVPAAIVFDLGRGGDPKCRPDPGFGAAAYRAASTEPPAQGCVGAGTGSVAGAIKGGIGSASVVIDGAVTVAVITAVNAAGSAVDPANGELYGVRFGLPGEYDRLRAPATPELDRARAGGQVHPPSAHAPAGPAPLNTTIGVVATDAVLTRPQCTKLAAVVHDGMARALRPCHSMQDGDSVFALATGRGPSPDDGLFFSILAAGADCFARAVVNAMLAATSVTTPVGSWPSYLDLMPSAMEAKGQQ